jgi:hypothetical protein
MTIVYNTTINSITSGQPTAADPNIVELTAKDFLESTQISMHLCYGCGFHFHKDFSNNEGLYGKLCWDQGCIRPLRGYRMKFGDSFFLKYINLSRQSIGMIHPPYAFNCELMPDTDYDNHKIVSLYNTPIP